MKIRDDSHQYDSIYHLALRWAKVNESDYPFAEFIQDANGAMNEMTAVIMEFDNTWEYDDPNHVDGNSDPDMPIAYTDLVAGQDNYPLVLSHLKIARLRIKGRDGKYKTLDPIDRRQATDDKLNEAADPEGYDKFGSVLFLVPKPDYSAEKGVELQYQRPPAYFTPDDDDKEPGINPQFHEMLALIPAGKFCGMNGYDEQLGRIEKELGQPPREGVEGTGRWGRLANSYNQRDHDRPQNVSLAKSRRSVGTLRP